MDFAALMNMLGPELASPAGPAAPAVPPAGGGMPPPSLPMSDGLPQMPPRAPVQAPAQRPKDLLLQLAPLVLSMFTARKDTLASAGLLQGMIRGNEVAQRQRVEAAEREREVKMAAARYMQEVAAQASRFSTPEEAAQYLAFAEPLLRQIDPSLPQGHLGRTVPIPAASMNARRMDADRKAAAERVAELQKLYGPELAENVTVTFRGQQMPYAALLQRAEMGAQGPQGAVRPPVKTEKPANLQRDDLLLQAAATRLGKPVTALTETEIKEALRQPPDPTLEAIRQLTLQNAQHAAANRPALPPKLQARVDALAKGFDAQPAVKRAVVLGADFDFVSRLDTQKATASDDQALVYAFAKSMDPDSAVRDGEYATVQKYATSIASQFRFQAERIFNSNTPFLTPESRAAMKRTIQTKYASVKHQYDAIRRSYVDRINRHTGQPGGELWLTDYDAAFQGIGQQEQPPGGAKNPANPTSGAPAVGERRIINGRLGEWDGKGWVPR